MYLFEVVKVALNNNWNHQTGKHKVKSDHSWPDFERKVGSSRVELIVNFLYIY